jgi:solute carrier family 45 protein 1/2/4
MLLNAEATRLGTRALFFSSIVSLATNFLAPYLVVTENDRERSRPSGNGFREVPGSGLAQRLRPPKMHIATLWAISHGVFAACMGATLLAALCTIILRAKLTLQFL